MREIDLKAIRIPGWLWVAAIAAIIFLARTYITDSGLVELIVVACFMVIKRLDLKHEDVDQLLGVIEQLNSQIVRLRQERVESVSPGMAARSSSFELPDPVPVNIKEPSETMTWLLG